MGNRAMEVVNLYIAEAVKKRGVNGLARDTGISRGSIQSYVHHRHKPSAENFLKIIFACNQSLDECAKMCFEIAQAMGEQE